MATHKPVKPDEKQIEHSQYVWGGFTKLMKYSTILCVITLAVLGLVFVDW